MQATMKHMALIESIGSTNIVSLCIVNNNTHSFTVPQSDKHDQTWGWLRIFQAYILSILSREYLATNSMQMYRKTHSIMDKKNNP